MTEKVVTTKTCELSFLEGDIVHARFNADRVVNAAEVQEMFEKMYDERDGRKSLFVVSVDDGTTLSNEARSLASSANASKYIVADAIICVIFSMSFQLMRSSVIINPHVQ